MDLIEFLMALASAVSEHPDMASAGAATVALTHAAAAVLPRLRWTAAPILWATRALFSSDAEKTKMLMGLPTLIAELAILPISILLGLRLAPSEMMCVKAHLKNLEHQLMPVESLRGRVDALEQYRHCDQYDDEERKSTSKLRRKKCQS